MLAKNKFNKIESLLSQALIDMKISHEEFIIILKQKDEYKKIKKNVRNLSEKLEEKQENMRLNGVHSRKTRLQRCDLLKSIEHLHHQKFLFVCVYV